jgi:3-oxoacyl-[acyl-carrier-protein] synthase III
VHLTVQKYGNMSAATVPVALVESLEENKIKPHAKLLMPAFGAGLTLCSHYIEWGERVTPKDVSDVALPPCEKTALELVNEIRAAKDARGRSLAGIENAYYADRKPYATQ